jgi:hypothetical protein
MGDSDIDFTRCNLGGIELDFKDSKYETDASHLPWQGCNFQSTLRLSSALIVNS